MSKHILLAIIAIVLHVYPCFAQQGLFYPLGKLSSNLITEITQDVSGFIWVGTENGLNKFDGWNFTQYFRNDKDSTSLIGDFVETFLTDTEGTLWIGVNRGLQYYCPETNNFRKVEFPQNIFPSVRDIVQLHTGEIWIVTAGYGIFSIDKAEMKANALRDLNDSLGTSYADRIFQDRANQIWVGLSSNKMACISPDGKRVETYQLPIDSRHNIYGIEEDHLGRMFIATTSNVFLWDNIRQEYISLENDKQETANIRGIVKLKDGTIYVHTFNQGLKIIEANSMVLRTPPRLPNGYSNPGEERVAAFFEDKSGNFWLGLYKKRLCLELNEPNQFEFWDFAEIGDGSFFSIYRDRKNDLWVGTDEGKLFRLDNQGNILSFYNLGTDISCLFEDQNGTFWVGSSTSGLYTFDRQTGKLTNFHLFGNNSIVTIKGDNKDNLYISVFGEGFVRYNFSKQEWVHISDTTYLNNSEKLFNNWIDDILCDSNGLVWLAESAGIDCYDPENHTFLDFTGKSELRSCISIALLEDKSKNIWIATNNGLFRYNKKENLLTHYGLEDGLPNNIICGLGADAEGNIWGSTLNGLFQFNVKDERIASYYSGNGLVDREYTKHISWQDKDGYIYFGGILGITRFLPDSVHTHSLEYQPILTHLYVNNELVSGNTKFNGTPVADACLMDASEIRLSYREKMFSLEFSTMNYHNPENIKFEYRLLEMDDVWNSTFPGENRITYNFLSPGNYTLEVRAFENNMYSGTKKLSIHITPPWYETQWVKSLLILFILGLLAGGLYMGYKRQLRRQKERNNEEKLKFFINIAHELRSPITLILSPLSDLLRQEDNDKKIKLLNTMQRNANRIMNLINQLLDLRKIDKGQMKISCEETDLVDFIKDLCQSFDYHAEKRNISFSFESDVQHLPVWIDRNNFDKVLINLIVNAFKFTPDAGEIMIGLTSPVANTAQPNSLQYAEIRIIDSGPGLNEKEIEKIFERFYQASSGNTLGFGIGLNLAKTLVELHHGNIHASIRADKQGSCFTVRILLGKKHLTDEEILQHDQNKRVALENPVYWDEKENDVVITKNKARKRVLVVDDDEEVRDYLKRELSDKYKVITANNGAEALRVLLQQRIDLVISDVMMPEVDGFSLLKKVKSNNNISHVPIVLLTSQVEFHNRMKGWDVGADGFMDKPFQIEELFLLCDNLISNRSLLKGKFGGIKELEDKVNPVEVKSNDEQFINRVMELVNKNLENSQFTVEVLAKEVGISRTQLHRKIKEIAGITTSDFMRNVRLKQAAKLITEKKINISQVAYAVGFNNSNVFTVAFKKFYGYTPTEYMERADNDNHE